MLKKVLCVLLALLLLPLAACSQKKEIQSVELPIEGVTLGMSIDDFSAFVYGEPGKVPEAMHSKQFTCEELHMNEPVFMGFSIPGDAKLMVYFENGAVKGVQATVVCKNTQALETELTSRYGAPAQDTSVPCGKSWSGAPVNVDAAQPRVYYIDMGATFEDQAMLYLVVTI